MGTLTRTEPRAGSEAELEEKLQPQKWNQRRGEEVTVSLRGFSAVSHQHWVHGIWGLKERVGKARTGFQVVTVCPLTGCLAMVAMAADPLGASDRHFPEVTPNFPSEGKEAVPQHR